MPKAEKRARVNFDNAFQTALAVCIMALLKYSENNLDFVLRDLEIVHGKMVTCGDTILYETEDGPEDFCRAGSLCHGWSAVACYIYRKHEKSCKFNMKFYLADFFDACKYKTIHYG